MLRITRRTGEVVEIAESGLVAGKVVPPAPARRRGPAATVRELQEVAARGWPATESERLGEWTLRAAGGFTERANSALPLGDCGMPLGEAVDRVEAWYAARSLPARIQVVTGDPGRDELLDRELAARGWVAEKRALMRTAALAPLADTGADTSRVRLSREPDEAWLEMYGRAEPGEGGAAHARRVLTGGPSVWFATVLGGGDGVVGADAVRGAAAAGRSDVQRPAVGASATAGANATTGATADAVSGAAVARRPGEQRPGDVSGASATADAGATTGAAADAVSGRPGEQRPGGASAASAAGATAGTDAAPGTGKPAGAGGTAGAVSADVVAIGRCVVDGRWAGFSALAVLPSYRRQGLAGAVMAALAGRALAEGASAAWLQVLADNGAAGGLYEGLGFTTHHAYHYRRAPQG
ncbi:GNAT family N-acetyltransferase [Streptomyces gamaensis]|uniref:GNAT family N-acetyltransferase n=1 Tax=Streptomyces gamaensis TaxID=1763542 RepID=A0ABW0YTJ8_9ACTN